MKTTTALSIIVLAAVIGYGIYTVRTNAPEKDALSDNSENTMDTGSDWNVNAAGLGIKIIKNGSGPAAKAGDTVAVDYTGTLEDGTVFDSSKGRQPIEFTLGTGMVIPGWEQGIAGMQVGEQRTLRIPPELAYGDRGAGSVIPPNATLLFDVELMAIK